MVRILLLGLPVMCVKGMNRSKSGLAAAVAVGLLFAFIFALTAGAETPTLESLGHEKGHEKAMGAFTRNVFPVLKEKCVKCHDGADADAPRLVMPQDPVLTYSTIRRYVANWADLSHSKLVTRGTSKDMAGGSLAPEQFVNVLQRWWDEGESAAFFEGKKVLSSRKLPASGEISLNWDLGEIDPQMTGARFEIEVKKTNGAYLLRNPKIEAETPVEVQGIHLVMNGAWNSAANGYVNMNAVASENQNMLSHAEVLMLEVKPGADELAFAFEKMELSNKIQSVAPEQKQPLRVATKTGTESILPVFEETLVGKAARFVPIHAPLEFEMGSPAQAKDRSDNETLHHVTLTHSFEIQSTSVTQLQWYLVMGSNPSRFKKQDQCDQGSFPEPQEHLPAMCKHHPVENVSWDDAQIFIQKLNQLQSSYTYRLPTEAEWEYVAHAGLPSEYAYGWGDEFDPQYAWYDGNSGNRTHAVGTKLPTPSPQNESDLLLRYGGQCLGLGSRLVRGLP